MEQSIIESLAALGIPGVALGIFYLLLKNLKFKFSEIPPLFSGAIAVIVLFLVGAISALSLYKWSPTDTTKSEKYETSVNDRGGEPGFAFTTGEGVVTYEEKYRSLGVDIVKIETQNYALGVQSEYAWIKHHYPNSELQEQALTTLEILVNKETQDHFNEKHFDRHKIKLSNGQEKQIYFDISEFYMSGVASILMNPDEFASKKLTEIYGK